MFSLMNNTNLIINSPLEQFEITSLLAFNGRMAVLYSPNEDQYILWTLSTDTCWSSGLSSAGWTRGAVFSHDSTRLAVVYQESSYDPDEGSDDKLLYTASGRAFILWMVLMLGVPSQYRHAIVDFLGGIYGSFDFARLWAHIEVSNPK